MRRGFSCLFICGWQRNRIRIFRFIVIRDGRLLRCGFLRYYRSCRINKICIFCNRSRYAGLHERRRKKAFFCLKFSGKQQQRREQDAAQQTDCSGGFTGIPF